MPNHVGTWTLPKVRAGLGLGLISTFLFLSAAAHAAGSDVRHGFAVDADHVRVRLGSSPERLEFVTESLRVDDVTYTKRRGEILRARLEKSPAGLLRLTLTSGGKVVLERGIAEPPLRLEAREAKLGTKNLPPDLIADMVNGIVDGKAVTGFRIELRAEVAFTDYLLGVLSREMPGTWPMEALKAQAVATRSYTLSQMRARSAWSFDLEGSILDQEFEWVTPQRRRSPALRRWAEALAATRDQVLRGAGGEVFRAYYHADCGGRTTTPEFVWGPVGEYRSVRDPACEARPSNKWKFVAEKSWLQKQLRDPGGARREPAAVTAGLEFSWIQSLFDQRVTLVEWWDGFSDLKILSGQNFRQLLGFGKLKSLRFHTRERGRDVIFEGQGYGHGVGLCQWGSKDWAEKGLSAERILNHYYPLARLGSPPRGFAQNR